jgi:predicted nucleotide-binding protein
VDVIFEHIVTPAAQAFGYEALRADVIRPPEPITAGLIRHVIESALVVADISHLNPNVMYQVGIRHAAGKPLILLAEFEQFLPFDMANVRTIRIDVTIEGVNRARDELVREIALAAAAAPYATSPIAAAIDLGALERLRADEIVANPAEAADAVVNALKAVETRLSSLETRFEEANVRSAQQSSGKYSNRVFVVHGHDNSMKNELARLLERIGLEPIILHEQPDRGQTVFAKLNDEMSDVGFAFILLTPDDLGTVTTDQQSLHPRARQNVVFEHGLFTARLGPARVCAIRVGDVEIPSDLQGVLYKFIPLGGAIRSIALELAAELRAAGYDVDVNRLLST